MKRAMGILLTPVACIVLSGCGLFLRGHHESVRDIMPRETDVPGWEIRAPHQYYPTEGIEKGRNELVKSGVLEYIKGRYSSLSREGMVLTITVYRCAGPLESFGLFSRERGFNSGKDQHERGLYARADGASFIRGEYYVKLMVEEGDDSLPKQLAVFRRVIEGNIAHYSGAAGLPEEAFFMAENDLLLDLVYNSSGYPSLEELGPLYIRRRSYSGRERRIFYTRRSGDAESRRLMADLLGRASGDFIVSKTGKLLYAFHGAPGSGFTAVARYKEWIFGAIDAENKIEAEIIIRDIYHEIRVSAVPGKG